MTAVTEARASVGRATVTPGKAPDGSPEQLARYQAAQDQLGSALQRLLVVSERYPELQARTQNFRDLQAQLEGTENRIAVARGALQRVRADVQHDASQVPDEHRSPVSSTFKERPYFKATTPAPSRRPRVQFNFGSPTPAASPAR